MHIGIAIVVIVIQVLMLGLIWYMRSLCVPYSSYLRYIFGMQKRFDAQQERLDLLERRIMHLNRRN